MKAFVISTSAFLLITGLIIVNAFICRGRAADLEERANTLYGHVSTEDFYVLSDEMEEIESDWHRILPYLRFTLHHNYLSIIETVFYSAHGALDAEDRENLTVYFSQLCGAFRELKTVVGVPQL